MGTQLLLAAERLQVSDSVEAVNGLFVMNIGGARRHSCFIPTFGLTRSVTRAITLRHGRPVRSIQEFRK